MSLILLNLASNQEIKLDSQNPVIIGRKNVDGCFDKRVSRNHGRVTCTTDGKLRLEALHFNPCFFARNGVPPVLQLSKDEEETLTEGDYLGLLPNAFWFKITSDKVTKAKIRPDFENTIIDQGSEENIWTGKIQDKRSATNSKADKTVTTKKKDSSVSKYEFNKGSLNPLPVPTGLPKGFGSEEFEKTRRLPLWMYEIYEAMDGNKQGSNKRSTPGISEKEKKQRPLPVAETDRSSRADHVIGNATDFPSTSAAKTEDKLTTNPLSAPNAPHAPNPPPVKDTESEKVRRPICEDGSTCHMQNPQHRAQFSHPGDEDYTAPDPANVSRDSSLHSEGNGKKASESAVLAQREGLTREDTVSSPHPLKRSRKRTKVHNENSYLDEDDDDDYDDDDDDVDDLDNNESSDEYLEGDKHREEDD